MKNLKKHIIFVFLLVVGASCEGVSNMMGVIKFPSSAMLKNPPRVYCAGRILPTEVDDKVKEVSFTFPCKSAQHAFFMVVTERVQPVFDPRNPNTVLYLKVPNNNAYKAYHLQLVSTERDDGKGSMAEWHIAPANLASTDNRLPDSAIIVLFPPESIGTLHGGTSFALPMLTVKAPEPETIELEQSKDISTKLLLSSLDIDTLHTVVPRHIKYIEDKGRTIIMPTM